MDSLIEILYVVANILLVASVAATIGELDRKYKEKKAAKKNKQDKNEE